MPTVVLGWDLDRGTRWIPPFEDALTRIQRTGSLTSPWQVPVGACPPPGTRVHLMLQGRTRGLVGRGVVRSAPFQAAQAGLPGSLTTFVLVEWDRLLPIDQRVPPELLAKRLPTVAWHDTYAAVHTLPDTADDPLDRLWSQPHPGTRHPVGWNLLRPMDGPRTLVGQVSRAIHHP